MLEYSDRKLYLSFTFLTVVHSPSLLVLQILKTYDAGIIKVINEVLLRMKSSDTLNDEEYLGKVYAKLVDCNSDEASVMSGSVSGVTRVKER